MENCGYLNNETLGGDYTMTMTFDKGNVMQSLAAFLIVRPKWGWLGYGWESDMKDWNEVFLWDVGEPMEDVCGVNGWVYWRRWSYGNVTLDCDTWTGIVPHK